MKIYEPNIHSKDYDHPIDMGAHFMFQIRPQGTMKFNDKIFLKKTVLETDVGSFISSLQIDEFSNPSYVDRSTAE